MTRLAIFASGRGSNAFSIIRHFQDIKDIEIVCICSNNPEPGVFKYAEQYAIKHRSFNAEERKDPNKLGAYLKDLKVDYVILAGYMKKIPGHLLEQYPDHILNIHPALLPKFGGKGMYGMNVHKAVIAAGEPISGISIHLVNEEYDEGRILFQEKVKIEPHDDAEELGKKVLKLEHRFYPEVIEKYVRGQI